MPDLLVVGSGAAGLSAALKEADLGARVRILTAGAPLTGSSPRLTASQPHSLQRLVNDLPQRQLIARLAAQSALLRQESRGAHHRTDVPHAREEWRGRIHWRRDHPPRFEEVLPE